MKDFIGNELSVEDTVVFPIPGSRRLGMGKVERVTANQVAVAYKLPGEMAPTKIRQTMEQVMLYKRKDD